MLAMILARSHLQDMLIENENALRVTFILRTGEGSILAWLFLDATNVLHGTMNSLTSSANVHVAHYKEAAVIVV